MRNLPNDYSRCSNSKCSIRGDCARFTSTKSKLHWFNNYEEKNCKHFINNK